MKLNAQKRVSEKKSDIAALRRSGKIPAVLYTLNSGSQKDGKKNELLTVETPEFMAALRGIKQGRLATTVFTLMLNGKEKKVVVKDIQYHPTTYNVIHLDFQELSKDSIVRINVPVSCIGVADCIGIKLGGFLRQVLRTVKVECPGDAIPEEFVVDVKDLGIHQTKRLSDLALPKGIKPIAAMNEVLVVIARR